MSLSKLQSDAVARLEALDYFKDLAVLSEQKHDIATEHQKAIDEMGLSVLVIIPLVEAIQTNHAKVNASVDLIVQVTENVPINQAGSGSQKHAIDVAMEAARALHFQQLGSFTRLEFQKLLIVLDDPLLVYQAQFKCQMAITPL